MQTQLLDGKLMAAGLMEELRARVNTLKQKGVTPGLAVILVGEDPASQVYVRNKGVACDELGLYSKTIRMPKETTQEALEAQIDALNHDAHIDGILVQLPLPKHLDSAAALDKISPDKDVDGFHIVNAGKLFTGREGVVACTPKGIMYMLKKAGIPLMGKHAVVIGRSNIVGKPIAMLLLNENCTVTICHSRTQHLSDIARQADILVAAVGIPHFVTADMIKAGAVVVDVGINRVEGKLKGDVDFDAAQRIASYITPVPGGVGKMTIGMLMDNTIQIAEGRA